MGDGPLQGWDLLASQREVVGSLSSGCDIYSFSHVSILVEIQPALNSFPAWALFGECRTDL